MTDIIEFQPSHLFEMDLRANEAEFLYLPDGRARAQGIYENSFQAMTVIVDGIILCSAGFSILWPGVGDGWIMPSIHVAKYPKIFCRLIRSYIETLIKTFNFHRFQTTSFHDKFHERWMEWLGFKREGIMEQFTHDKKSHCMYARLA